MYATGFTDGSLEDTNAGGYDAYVRKYDALGELLWTRQLGTSGGEFAFGLSADGLGSVYVTGYTTGNLEGTNSGESDAFVSKYDASGGFLWTRQFGTSGGEFAYSVSADGLGNLYLSGFTQGSLEGINAGSRDAFVRKYDASGGLHWTRQFGTSGSDESRSISADGLGSVHVAGVTDGSLVGSSAGGRDAFVRKYDASGALLWARQFGTNGSDDSRGISADDLGNVYVVGNTSGNLDGTSSGVNDAFVRKYDASGALLWARQFGTSTRRPRRRVGGWPRERVRRGSHLRQSGRSQRRQR